MRLLNKITLETKLLESFSHGHFLRQTSEMRLSRCHTCRYHIILDISHLQSNTCRVLLYTTIDILSRWKGLGLAAGFTSEHLHNCFWIISTVLSKLFYLMILCHNEPFRFRHESQPIVKDCRSTAMDFTDFIGIVISFALSSLYNRQI